MIKMRTSQVDELQKKWEGGKCNHDKGYGIELDDKTGCNCDYFCLQCGMRHTSSEYFKKRIESNKE